MQTISSISQSAVMTRRTNRSLEPLPPPDRPLHRQDDPSRSQSRPLTIGSDDADGHIAHSSRLLYRHSQVFLRQIVRCPDKTIPRANHSSRQIVRCPDKTIPRAAGAVSLSGDTGSVTPQVSLSTPLTCVLSHLSLSHTGEPGSLPINNDTLAAFAVGEPAVVNARAATAARIISNQPAGLTQKLYLAHFTRWHNFATRRGVPSIPTDNQSYQALRKQVACLDAFATDVHHQHSTRWQSAGHTGRAAGNKSGTFNQIFYGINHIITKIYGRPPPPLILHRSG